MSLILKIQESIVDSNRNINDILRLCKILANNLKNVDFNKWINGELNGFSSKENLPEYRIIPCLLQGDFVGYFGRQINNAPIPLMCLPESIREDFRNVYFTNSIAEINNLADNSNSGSIHLGIPPDFNILIGNNVYQDMQCISSRRIVSTSALIAVIDKIKTIILDFILAIQNEKIVVDDVSNQNNLEKVNELVHQHFYGTIQNLSINSSNFSQLTTVNVSTDDIESLILYLKNNGIGESDLSELENAIKQDGIPQSKDKFGIKVSEWMGKIITNGAKGAYNIGVNVVANIIANSLSQYYGFK